MVTEAGKADAPIIILVRPQLSENIGTSARAMLNCGLEKMRIVAPRENWLSDKARAACSGADKVLEQAEVFDTTEAAVADLQRVYATTGRNRFMVKPVADPRQAAQELRTHEEAGLACGVLFGPERTGLENDDVALADKVIMAPLNPGFASLNLAQAVLLISYEWHTAGMPDAPVAMTKGATPPATKEELVGFFDHLERELDDCGFFRVAEKRPGMVRNIRNMFERSDLTSQEVRTLHGIVHELVTLRKGKDKVKLDALTAFGLVAVTLMLVTYALEARSRWFIFAFAGSCVLGSIYGFLQGAWPFGLVEGIWALVAARRWWMAGRSSPHP